LKLKQEEMSEVIIRKEMMEKKLGNVNKDYELTVEKLQVSWTGHRYNSCITTTFTHFILYYS